MKKKLTFNESDIRLVGKEHKERDYFNGRWHTHLYLSDIKEVYFKGVRCQFLKEHSRRVFSCKKFGVVIKIDDDDQNHTEHREYKKIARKHPELEQFFAKVIRYYPKVAVRDKEGKKLKNTMSVLVQEYVVMCGKPKNILNEIIMDGLNSHFCFQDMDSGNIGRNLAYRKDGRPVIFDLGVECV